MGKAKAATCPVCGKPYLSKAEMVVKILERCGIKTDKSIYGDGNFTRDELLAVYNYVTQKKGDS